MRAVGRLPLRVGLLTLFLWSGMAGATTTTVHLDFNLLPDGSTPPISSTFPFLQPVGATYATSGVTFGSLDGDDISIQPKFNPDDAPRTDWSVFGGTHAGPGSHGFHVLAIFSAPVTFVSASLCTGSLYSAVMSAYDAYGTQIGTIASPASPGQCKGFFTLEDLEGDITSVVWTSSDPFVAGIRVDDLTFTMIPEPGSASLLALGLTGLAFRTRRGPRA